MYDIFGKYGAIRQIRLGNASGTKVRARRGCRHWLRHSPRALPQGTAFVVYEDIYDAKNACVRCRL